ncbi:hypothetical protein C8Q80DRAFT_774775 [Daedaleopsis nitida]|nr:hypothetical protein C8Q80DRAFT_774775 [Daedaleopsis nitida]
MDGTAGYSDNGLRSRTHIAPADALASKYCPHAPRYLSPSFKLKCGGGGPIAAPTRTSRDPPPLGPRRRTRPAAVSVRTPTTACTTKKKKSGSCARPTAARNAYLHTTSCVRTAAIRVVPLGTSACTYAHLRTALSSLGEVRGRPLRAGDWSCMYSTYVLTCGRWARCHSDSKKLKSSREVRSMNERRDALAHMHHACAAVP